MVRQNRLLPAAILLIATSSFLPAQQPEAMPTEVHSYPPGVVDMTPQVMPGSVTSSPQCHFIPANDPVAPFVVSVEYLLIQPRRTDLDYALVDPNNNLSPEGHIAALEWQTRSGIRAGFIWRPRNNATELGFTYTYAYSQDQANITAPAGGVLFPTLTRPGIVDQALTAQAFSSVDFHVVDIDVGRRFTVDDTDYRLFTGARLAEISQVLAATYNGLNANQALASNRSCMDAGGVTLGGEARWRFARNFGAFARGRGSLIVGDYCLRATETDFAGNVVNADVTDRFMKVVPVLDLTAGLSWHRRNWRASIGYEISHWFNQSESITFLDDLAFGKHGRKQSDLSLEAVSFQVAVEY